MKTILLYTDSHSFCGVGRYNAALLTALSKTGYRLVCAQCRENTPLQSRLKATGVIYQWFDYDPNQQPERFANDHSLAQALMDRVDPDLVVFSNGSPTNTYSGVLAARQRKVPYIIWEGHVRTEAFTEAPIPYDDIKKNYLASHATIFVARHNLEIVKNHFNMPDHFGVLIPTFASSVFYGPINKQRRAQLRAKWGVPKDGILCVTSAKFEPVKGYEIQIRALEILKRTHLWDRIYFMWAGEGTYRQAVSNRLRDLALKDHVQLPGHVWNLDEILDAGDVFMLTSYSEGLPLTILEAMAKGLPVIATDVGGNREALEGCGKIISSPSNVEQTANELSCSIIDWIENPEHRLQCGLASRARAEDRYSETNVIGQQIALIQSVFQQT